MGWRVRIGHAVSPMWRPADAEDSLACAQKGAFDLLLIYTVNVASLCMKYLGPSIGFGVRRGA